MKSAHSWILFCWTVAACGESTRTTADAALADAQPDAGPRVCNPVGGSWDCFLPYPSNAYLVPDPSLPSGSRVQIPESARVRDSESRVVDLHRYHSSDGFSASGGILVKVPVAIDSSLFVTPYGDPTPSTLPGSSTLIIDTVTGARIAHFTEIDPRARADADRSLTLRPFRRLDAAKRYVVALQGIRSSTGTLIDPPAEFADLRERRVTSRAPQALHDRYETDVFPVLDRAGVSRSALTLAWDFTTSTDENLTRDLLDVRAQTLASIEAGTPSIRVVTVARNVSVKIALRVELAVRVPLFTRTDIPLSPLNRDDAGRVTPRGTTEIRVDVTVPPSVLNASDPAPVIHFGHGFFGSHFEAAESFMAELSDTHGVVLIATDWSGMSIVDSINIAAALATDASTGMNFVDRIHQGIANFMFVAALGQTAVPQLAELQHDGRPLLDRDRFYFYGISQGQILGTTFLAMSPHIRRAALSVGGACFNLMMFRSRNFQEFLDVLDVRFSTPLDVQKFVMMTQEVFDRIDPVTYASRVISRPLTGSPEKRVLIQLGIGDAQVPNIASALALRELGVPTLRPSRAEFAFIDGVDSPANSSAATWFDFGVTPLPGITPMIPSAETAAHEAVRRLPNAQRQMLDFFQTGTITHPCTGPC